MPRYGKKDKNLIGQIRRRIFQKFDNRAVNDRRRLIRYGLLALALIMFVSLFIGDTGFIRIGNLHLEKYQLEKANHQLLIELIDADMTRDRLKNDPRFIEYIARTRHFMSRPGEVIYRFK